MQICRPPREAGTLLKNGKGIPLSSKVLANLNEHGRPKLGEMSKLEQVVKGVKREYAKTTPGKQVRLPITHDILLKLGLCGRQEAKDYDSIML